MISLRKGWAEMLPKDPVILLSFVNTKLRDEYASLKELCASLDVSESQICEALSALNYAYDSARNQFI
jgi:hypothetical protein